MNRATTTTTRAATTATRASFSPEDGRLGHGAAGARVGKLFSAHGRMVLGLCQLLLRDPVDAEDAAQQVFLSAHKALVAGAVPRDPPAWLAAIARNECRARIRVRMRAPLELPELPADLPDPLAAAIHAADLDALWIALSELPRRQRRAFLLRELGGLSYGELGAALGVTRPAVESLLFRARRQLRDLLADANAALVPLALRDQLVRLIPDFGASAPMATVPVAAKIAAVTVGLGLGAAGVVALPRNDARQSSGHQPAPSVVQPQNGDVAAPLPAPSSSSAAVAAEETGRQDGVRRVDGRREREGAQRADERRQETVDNGGSGDRGDSVAPTVIQTEPQAEQQPESGSPSDGGGNLGDGSGSSGDSGSTGVSGSSSGG